MKKLILLSLVLIFLLSSCATIFSGNTDEVEIDSEPNNATVRVDGRVMGKTPIALTLEKGNTYNLSIEKEGYETTNVRVLNKTNGGWIVLDVLVGFVPVIVDAVTGAWSNLKPDNIHVILEPIPASN